MSVTRAVVDIRTRGIDSPGVLKDIDGVVSLLARHNEDMEALSNAPSGASSVHGANEASNSAASGQSSDVANGLPQVGTNPWRIGALTDIRPTDYRETKKKHQEAF
jgi:hypothetical protein